jgi:AraC-like DNA-binding protein
MSITSTSMHRAEIEFHEAASALQPFVGCLWVVTAQRDATIRVVPDGSTAISVQVQDGEPLGWFLRGPLVQPELRRYASMTTVIGVRLRPGVAFIVSGLAANSIVGRNIRLNDVAVEPTPHTPMDCIDVLQRFLLRRIHGANVHAVVATAIREIEREHGCLGVAQIASRCGVSPRHLNSLMRTWVGYGPKRFANIVRFQETLHQIDRSPDRSAATLASDAGFFDQAHLTTNVTRFAGATPRHLASSCVADFSKTRCDDLP